AGEILRAAGPLHVFVERQALGEWLGSNDAPGHPVLLDLRARLGRRGPSPATACGAHFHLQASLGAISSVNRRRPRSTSARGSIEPWSNQQMICESPNSSRAAWSRSTTSPASPNTPWSRQNFSYGRLARVSSIIFKRGRCSPYETGICAKTV